jgi:hypothetical protein
MLENNEIEKNGVESNSEDETASYSDSALTLSNDLLSCNFFDIVTTTSVNSIDTESSKDNFKSNTAVGTLFYECIKKYKTSSGINSKKSNLFSGFTQPYPNIINDLWQPTYDLAEYIKSGLTYEDDKVKNKIQQIIKAADKRAEKSNKITFVILKEFEECLKRDTKEIPRYISVSKSALEGRDAQYLLEYNRLMQNALKVILTNYIGDMIKKYGNGISLLFIISSLISYGINETDSVEIIINHYISYLKDFDSQNVELYESDPSAYTIFVIQNLIHASISDAKQVIKEIKSTDVFKNGGKTTALRVAQTYIENLEEVLAQKITYFEDMSFWNNFQIGFEEKSLDEQKVIIRDLLEIAEKYNVDIDLQSILNSAQ